MCVCVCVCVCLSVKSHLISGASVRPENTVTYSAGNGGQKICGVFFETAPFKSYGVKRKRKLERHVQLKLKVGSVHCWKRYSFDRSSTHACTPSCSNRWCFAVHRTGIPDRW